MAIELKQDEENKILQDWKAHNKGCHINDQMPLNEFMDVLIAHDQRLIDESGGIGYQDWGEVVKLEQQAHFEYTKEYLKKLSTRLYRIEEAKNGNI